ncbi:MAG TPA: ArsA family ATPase [Acidimicrobiales bacterium]|jgi:anion-transporting  ArsA/GET3 family ATPase|nr:ArsA family ATPase [Acidimicrobiales bacterium]
MSELAGLVSSSSILVCCGTGGVGKTTVAAALGLEGARLGRRTCVVTVDPARRLADALGLDSLPNSPTPIAGPWPGELHGLMLDPKSTFDELVKRNAADPEQAERILTNRLYRNLTQALSGTQEYMAMEKLHELHEEGGFDLVVVDTPPTRNALDFIDAPRRLTRFLENRVFRALMAPTRAYLRAVGLATQALLRSISKVVGSEVVSDAIGFFQAFEGMEEGFRDRAGRVLALLSEPSTAFVLVASPRTDAVDEALFFVDKLEEASIAVRALVVNRMHPRFASPPPEEAHGKPAAGSHLERTVADLRQNLAQLAAVAAREEANIASLAKRLSPAPVARVPFLADDVHDLEGLEQVRARLFP